MTPVEPPVDAVSGTFLALLDPPERDALHSLGIRRAFPRGVALMFQHEPGERVMLLLAGRVKVTRVAGDGREMLLSIRDPGDVLGELALIDDEPRLATVTALEPVQALIISPSTFRQHLESTPRVAVALLEVVTRRFRETTLKRSQSTQSDTMGRLAARILELADRYGEPAGTDVRVISPLSREDLAGWTGASRAGVAHALRELRELGWVHTERRTLIVRDIDELRTRAA
ncbi:MAG TPA: Crp/Fnr family transcriptional regulator [Solirubrobacteraceae bacterium]|jgi:CRP-like cAMP-binding protein